MTDFPQFEAALDGATKGEKQNLNPCLIHGDEQGEEMKAKSQLQQA